MTLLRKVAQTGAEALRNINADYYNQMADALNSIPTGSAEHAGLINCAARLIRSHATKCGPDNEFSTIRTISQRRKRNE